MSLLIFFVIFFKFFYLIFLIYIIFLFVNLDRLDLSLLFMEFSVLKVFYKTKLVLKFILNTYDSPFSPLLIFIIN